MTGVRGITGVQATADVLFSGMPTALTIARDGIVGFPSAPVAAKQLVPGEDETMKHWSCEVRTLMMQADLLSRICCIGFDKDSDDQEGITAVVYYVDATSSDDENETPAAILHKLIELVRPDPEDFSRQAKLVLQYADLRADRLPEIITQLTLPLDFYSRIIGLNTERHSHTFHICLAVHNVATKVAMLVKNALASLRPEYYSPQVQPVIPTPGHSSLPSGHSTQAFAIALVLARLIGASDETRRLLLAQAARIAVNRTVAGVHFPIDSLAGLALGRAVADFIIGLAEAGTKDSTSIAAMRFDGRGSGGLDFRWSDYFPEYRGANNPDADRAYAPITANGGPLTFQIDHPHCAILEWQWREARMEWGHRVRSEEVALKAAAE